MFLTYSLAGSVPIIPSCHVTNISDVVWITSKQRKYTINFFIEYKSSENDIVSCPGLIRNWIFKKKNKPSIECLLWFTYCLAP